MLNVDVTKLDSTWQELKKFLKDGLLYGDIWDTNTGLSLSSQGDSNPATAALFNQLTDTLSDTLDGSGFPALGKYYLLNLSDKLFIVINHGDDILQGVVLNPAKVNMGILFNVAIPKALAAVKAARA